jgi:MFS family permease
MSSVPTADPIGGSAVQAPARGLYRGWWMVLIGFFCIAFASSAPPAMLPLIYPAVKAEFGWSTTAATSIYFWKQIASALLALFVVGPMIERMGLRFTMTFLCVCTALGMTTFLFVHSQWTYNLSGFLFGMGGTTILVPVKVLVSRWFNRNQGIAIGLVMLGMSTGGVVMPLLGTVLIRDFGWRIAFASLSLGIWLVALPLYLWKANDRPTEADLLRETMGKADDPAAAERLRAADLDDSLRAILHTPMFWAIGTGLFMVGMIDTGMLQHTILYMKEEAHLSPAVAAATLSGTFLIGLFAKLIAGFAYDRWSVRGIQAWYGMLGVSILMVFWVSDLKSAIFFTIFRGIAHGGLVSEMAVMAKHCYGPKLMNRCFPVMTGLYGVGAAVGPMFLALMHDRFHSYTYGFGVFAVMAFGSAALLTVVRPLYRERLHVLIAQG